ncbi:hypothetical protein HDU93_002603, partial [Gonapodya sp. JEL0774]
MNLQNEDDINEPISATASLMKDAASDEKEGTQIAPETSDDTSTHQSNNGTAALDWCSAILEDFELLNSLGSGGA